MEKRDQEEYKHVCKLCNKRFPSGKSLGGHMRSHVIANSKASALKLKSTKKAPTFETKFNGDDDLGGAGYELRENPKKSWRVEDEKLIESKQERICKKCGKGFQSLKALCGHMSCHSNKERNFSRLNGYDYDEDEDEDDDDSWDSNEDEEGEEEEELGSENHHQRLTKFDSFSFGNGCSSNVSEIEHEQEEVAICLMMLSRDSGQKVGVNFTTESSDNNSVILGDWSSSTFNKANMPNNLNGFVKTARKGMMKCVEMDNSDSGYFENGAKELESDDSVDGYSRNYGFKRNESKFGSGFVERDEERDPGQLKRQFRSKGKSSAEFDDYEMYDRGGTKKMKHENLSSSKMCHKLGKYECSVCQRTFKTHQALGGHIITHKRSNGGYKGSSTRQENDDDHHLSVEISNFGSKFESSGMKISIGENNVLKKPKVHKCPFCPKVFKSGQALGGHKRSHLIGCSSEDRAILVQSVERNLPSNRHPLLDLNLPAPAEEEAGGSGNGGHF